MSMFVEDRLVCPITVLDSGKPVLCSTVGIRDISTIQLFEARAASKEGEFWGLHELAAKAYVIDAEGKEYALPYSVLAETSSANLKVIEQLDNTLSLKLKAESLLNPSK